MSNISIFSDTENGKLRGRMTGQNVQSKGTEISHWMSLYADDNAFILPTREDAIKTTTLVENRLKQFGL